ADLLAPQPIGVLLAGICAALVAAVIGVAAKGGIAVYATIGLLGVAAVGGSLLVTGAAVDVPAAVSIVAVGLFLAGTLGPGSPPGWPGGACRTCRAPPRSCSKPSIRCPAP